MKSTLPLVVGFVLVFAFVLMLVAFRSLVVAAKAIVLNLLSVAAAYGVLVIVFQHGVGKGLLGFSSTAGIDPMVPLLLFVILFGLSMDYHVLILGRIREAYDRGADMDEAISHGIKCTAGVVTSAAVVMVGVFSIFATLSMLMFKQFGVGLATAILIDATIVRAVLLPATMKLLGERNWYLPALARVAAAARRPRVRAGFRGPAGPDRRLVPSGPVSCFGGRRDRFAVDRQPRAEDEAAGRCGFGAHLAAVDGHAFADADEAVTVSVRRRGPLPSSAIRARARRAGSGRSRPPSWRRRA